MEVSSTKTKKQKSFYIGPYWDTNQIKVGCRMSRWCSPNIIHIIHGNQANNNTKINIGHSFKDTKAKLCHLKVVPPNKTFLSYPQYFNVSRMEPLIMAMFPTNPIPEVPLSRRLKFFYLNWAKLTEDPNILNIGQGFEITFLENPVQGKSPNPLILNQEQSNLVKRELKEMLLKGAIQPVSPCKYQYLSNVFLVSKRFGGNRLVINLKHLNNFIPYQHFKMEGLNLLQNRLQKGNYISRVDLTDAYFCVPLKRNQGNSTASVGGDTIRVPHSFFLV